MLAIVLWGGVEKLPNLVVGKATSREDNKRKGDLLFFAVVKKINSCRAITERLTWYQTTQCNYLLHFCFVESIWVRVRFN